MRDKKNGQVIKNLSLIMILMLFLSGCIANSPYSSPWSVPYHKQYGQNTKQIEQKPVINWRTSQKRESLKIYYNENRNINGVEQSKLEETQAQTQNSNYNYIYQQSSENHSQQYEDKKSSQYYMGNNFGQRKEIVVALLLPMTGKYSHLGKSMMNAAQMALFDLDTDAFKLLPKDTKGTEIGAKQAAIEAVQEGADLILGPVFSQNARAVKSVINSSNIPMITYTTDWKVAGGNTYVMGFLPFSQVIRVVNYAHNNGYTKTAFFGPTNDYSNIVLRTLHYSLKRYGQYTAKEGYFYVGQPDSHVLIQDFIGVEIPDETEPGAETEATTAVKEDVALPFDSILIPIGGQALKSVTNMFAYYNVDKNRVKFLGTGLWDDESLIYEQSLHGAWFAAPDPNLRADFEKRYKENYAQNPERLASLAYDSLALAIVLAKTYDGTGEPYSRNRLVTQQGYAGIDGIFRFRLDNLIERGLAVLEVTPRGLKVIDPAPEAFFIVNN